MSSKKPEKPKQLSTSSSKAKVPAKKTNPGAKTSTSTQSKSSNSKVNEKSPKENKTESKQVVENDKSQEISKLSEPAVVVLTEDDIKRAKAAVRIQTTWRGYRARKKLAYLRLEKKTVDERLVKLEQEAYLQMVRLQQEKEEREFEKRLKQEAARRARDARRKKFLEAAYDGKLTELEFLVDDARRELDADPRLDPPRRRKLLLQDLIDCRDPNGNTPLSEAAASGSAQVVKFLLTQNADVNSRGSFGRTPLWRSSFGGHLNCVQVLLENGADPRLYSDDGQRCIDAATQQTVIDVLQNWNTALTDRMLDQIVKSRLEQRKQLESSLEQRKRAARSEFEGVQSQLERCKIELYKCRCELQRLNDEYLTRPDMYGPLIDTKEKERGELESRYESLREKVVKARIVYKELAAEIRRERRQIKEDEAVGKQKKSIPMDDDDDDDDGGSDSEDEIDERKVFKSNFLY